jgi:hypothetical protein
MMMRTLALALGGLAVWIAAPSVAMATHGTTDQRTRAAWRARAAQAGGRAPAPVVAIPAPRGAEAGTRVPA